MTAPGPAPKSVRATLRTALARWRDRPRRCVPVAQGKPPASDHSPEAVRDRLARLVPLLRG
jgi:hypothetical protein